MSDREQALILAARSVTEELRYDPHFADMQSREIAETRLFLARMDALNAYYQSLAGFKLSPEGELIPIYSYETERRASDLTIVERFRSAYPLSSIPESVPLILWCPKCAMQHIDAAEDHKPTCPIAAPVERPCGEECNCGAWANPPHRSHLCAYCGHVWRPADVPTTGVAEICTVGEKDDPEPVRGKLARFHPTVPPRWRHKERQTIYDELARAELQKSGDYALKEGDILVVYVGKDNKAWARFESEFDDGRFEVMGRIKVL